MHVVVRGCGEEGCSVVISCGDADLGECLVARTEGAKLSDWQALQRHSVLALSARLVPLGVSPS